SGNEQMRRGRSSSAEQPRSPKSLISLILLCGDPCRTCATSSAMSTSSTCTARPIRAIKSAGRRREFGAIEHRLCRNLARWGRHKPRRPAQFIPSFEPTEGRARALNAGASSKLLSGAAGLLEGRMRALNAGASSTLLSGGGLMSRYAYALAVGRVAPRHCSDAAESCASCSHDSCFPVAYDRLRERAKAPDAGASSKPLSAGSASPGFACALAARQMRCRRDKRLCYLFCVLAPCQRNNAAKICASRPRDFRFPLSPDRPRKRTRAPGAGASSKPLSAGLQDSRFAYTPAT
ncbi:hypothetical protein HDZ31DRAFT_77552, partial [Schizophyllum fasciatum]